MDSKCDESLLVSQIRSCRNLKNLAEIHSRVLSSRNCRCNKYLRNLIIHMYGKCGSLADAKAAFDSMDAPNAASWNIIIGAYARAGHFAEAENLVDKMPYHEPASYTALLSGYAAAGRIPEAKAVFDRMPERNIVTWNAMLGALAESGHILAARDVFDRMPETNEISWSTMIAAYARGGRMEEARWLFDQRPCPSPWPWPLGNMVLGAYAELGFLEKAEEFFAARMATKDIVSWTILVKAYAEKRQVHKSRALFEQMPERDVMAFNVMLSAYAGAGDGEGARSVIELMPEWDEISCTALIIAFAGAGDLRAAEEVFVQAPSRDVISWSAMLEAIVRGRDSSDAKRFFDSMPERNLVTWNSMIQCFADDANQPMDGVEMLWQMAINGLDPDRISFICALIACGNAGLCPRALFSSMVVNYGIMPRTEHYATVVAILARSGDIEIAERVLEEMPFGAAADGVAREALLGGFGIHGGLSPGVAVSCSSAPLDAGALVVLSNAMRDSSNQRSTLAIG